MFLVSVVVLLLASNTCFTWSAAAQSFVNHNPPRIYPGNGEVVISSGANLTLTCSSRNPVLWDFPRPDYPQNIMEDFVERVHVETSFNFQEDHAYLTTLVIRDASYLDTGYFYCMENGTADVGELDKVDSVYVYVSDPNHLFVSLLEFDVISASEHTKVVIPCRPTNPNITVSILRNSAEEMVSSGGAFTRYDPREGLIITNPMITKHSGTYDCNAELGDYTESIYRELLLLTKPNYLASPVINDSLSNPAILGGNITLLCSVTVEMGVIFDMNWTLPNSRALQSGRAIIGNHTSTTTKINKIESRMTALPLYIYNVASEDEGMYTCTVRNHEGHTSKDSKFIEVIDEGHTYLDLQIQGPETIVGVAGAQFVQWLVDMHAYPSPELVWFKPNGEQIISNSKYEMSVDPRRIKLKISSVELADAGTYILEAKTQKFYKKINLTLIVVDRPSVLISNGEILYMKDKPYVLECNVMGHPTPAIHWSFKSCSDYSDCSMDSEQIYDNISESPCGAQCVTSKLKVTKSVSGVYTCYANNTRGYDQDTAQYFITDVTNGFELRGPKNPVEGDNVTLFCGASIYNYTDDVRWFINTARKMQEIRTSQDNILITDSSTEFSYQKSLTIVNISMADNAEYVCRVPKNSDASDEEDSIRVSVIRAEGPSIVSTNMEGQTQAVEVGSEVKLTCQCGGIPMPEVTWYKDGRPYDVPANDTKVVFLDNKQVLLIKFANTDSSGAYKCMAANRKGMVSSEVYTLHVEGEYQSGIPVPIIIGIAVITGVLLVILFFVCFKLRRKQRKNRELKELLRDFEQGREECINPDLPIDDQVDLLPFDRKWEFPRDKLNLGKQLGCGAFGRVLKAEAYGIIENQPSTTVAVKTVKLQSDITHVKALLSELKVMAHLGKHLNVVNLLGACTKELQTSRGELLVIVEYCRFGNLQNYLLRHRDEFVNQIDPATGKLSLNIGAGSSSMSMHRISANDSRGLKYASLTFSDPRIAADYRGRAESPVASNPSDYSGIASNVATDVTFVSMSPSGGNEENPLDSVGSQQSSTLPMWCNNYRGDYKGSDVRPLVTSDLLCWAFQIARGMEYLSSRKILHRDLAARNVLLADDNVVKICDFGLAKEMYKTNNYKKKTDGLLPIKWMALESIQDQLFSTQSDVWSFGILTWELFSLGKTPYPGMQANERLYKELARGYRMAKPKYATADIYNLMLTCWKENPLERPSFSDLVQMLGEMLENTTREHYLNLNEPFQMSNEQRGDAPDYLGMVASPDFQTMTAHNTQDQAPLYINLPALDEEGYLLMNTNSPLHKGSPIQLVSVKSVKSPPSQSSDPTPTGYLLMKGSDDQHDDVFSPRPNLQPFSFPTAAPRRNTVGENARAESTELKPMLTTHVRVSSDVSDDDVAWTNPWANDGNNSLANSQDSGIASPTTTTTFFNPNYRSAPVVTTADTVDYCNMPTITESDETKNGYLVPLQRPPPMNGIRNAV